MQLLRPALLRVQASEQQHEVRREAVVLLGRRDVAGARAAEDAGGLMIAGEIRVGVVQAVKPVALDPPALGPRMRQRVDPDRPVLVLAVAVGPVPALPLPGKSLPSW